MESILYYYGYGRNIKVQEDVKRLVRLEKKRQRKTTIERTREQGRTSCKLFWADLKEKKNRQIQRWREEDGVVVE